jgi:hypothetical protein
VLEVSIAREAVEVWEMWRPGQTPSLDDKVAAVIYYRRTTLGSRSNSRRG